MDFSFPVAKDASFSVSKHSDSLSGADSVETADNRIKATNRTTIC